MPICQIFRLNAFFRKKSAREVFKYRNLTEKGFLMREAQNFFRFCPLNYLKYLKKAKKCIIIVKNIIREELISSLFPCFFSRSLFLPPPGEVNLFCNTRTTCVCLVCFCFDHVLCCILLFLLCWIVIC